MSGSIKIKCKVEGGAEMAESLRELGGDIGRKLFRGALKAVGEATVEVIKPLVPVDSGDLRDSIGYKIRTRRKGDEVAGSVQIGPMYDAGKMKNAANKSASPGVYGMFVEFGLKQKKYKFTPFMRPAFDGFSERMVTIFADKLREDLEEAIKSSGPDGGDEG